MASRCRECREAVEFLKTQRATFTAYDLDQDLNAREKYYRLYGHGRLPLVANSMEHERGFNPATLRNLIKPKHLIAQKTSVQAAFPTSVKPAASTSQDIEQPSIDNWPNGERERKSEQRILEGISKYDDIAKRMSLTPVQQELYVSVVRPQIESQFVLPNSTPEVKLNETNIGDAIQEAAGGTSAKIDKINRASQMKIAAQNRYRHLEEQSDAHAEAEAAKQKLLNSSFGQDFLMKCTSGAFMNTYREEVMTVDESQKIESSIVRRCTCLLYRLANEELTEHAKSRLIDDFSTNAELRPWFNETHTASIMKQRAGLGNLSLEDPYLDKIFNSLVECVSSEW